LTRPFEPGGACPGGRERAKNLLWAAGKLADYGIGLGLDPVPETLLHPSVIERFATCAPGLSGVAVVPRMCHAPRASTINSGHSRTGSPVKQDGSSTQF
jgi:hypothetical protein